MQTDMSKPLVVAVVLTWNDTEQTTKCLASVLSNDYPNLKVVLVDNGSQPECGPQLKSLFPEIELVQLPENQGFSGGANRGMEKALELGADYVHLIGNDSTLASNVESLLVEAFEAHPEVGAASPLLLFSGNEDKPIVQFYRATIDREMTMHQHFDVSIPYDAREWPTIESEFIPCVALCFRATALREVGLMDEVFGTCWEDYDICLRFHDKGWKYLVVGDAHAVHFGSFTTGRESPYITYYTVRNRLICINRYAPKNIWLRKGPQLIMSFWRNQIMLYGLTNWECHKAFIRGLWDYVFDKHGERTRTEQGSIPGEGHRVDGIPEHLQLGKGNVT